MVHVVSISVEPCETCGSPRGHLIEKYNGLVPVYCKCDVWNRDKRKRLADPCCIWCKGHFQGPRSIWMPTTTSCDPDGVWRYSPGFNGNF